MYPFAALFSRFIALHRIMTEGHGGFLALAVASAPYRLLQITTSH